MTPLLTVPQVAERLALDVATIYRLVETGDLGCIKVASSKRGALRFTESHLEEWLARHERPARTSAPPRAIRSVDLPGARRYVS